MGQSTSPHEIVLSLISHTNVGKTALARTLLRMDVGEVADSAHVTIVPEAYTLIEEGDYSARLWDTPGFGANLAKLAKRLRSNENPVGWILHQVWDRHRDKSLWCSQEAIRNVQSESDLVLYLVDASQPPSSVGYIDLEIEVLEWIGKPVLVFLNQTGQPDPEKERLLELEWRAHLGKHDIVKHVDTLDAFTRCWTEEHHILAKAAEILEGDRRRTAKILAKAWARRNKNVFEEAVAAMADWAFLVLTDTEALPQLDLGGKLRQLISKSERNRELDRIQEAMYERLAEKTSETVNRLIALYGLDGETASRLERTSRDGYAVNSKLEEPLAATVGGAVSGLAGGLAADLAAGGMTFGGGAIVGMLLGGATTYALARGYNLAQTGKNQVRWSGAHFLSQVKFLIMLYLAISHYGRGRGSWRDPVNNPAHWEDRLTRLLDDEKESWQSLWKKGGAKVNREKLQGQVKDRLRKTVSGVLCDLYPESADIF